MSYFIKTISTLRKARCEVGKDQLKALRNSICYRTYAKYKRMLNGMFILDISFQNKLVITLGTFGKSVGPGDLMYLKVCP